ncbi:hypothetical protein OCT51_11145 [Halomonas sp. LR3S48]|uniref:hypothetical protein n=1 Tax=Halomonas sp. LR3S48 TaxID=2982694 RepID=UPI0021E35A0A|nr:hypothetical protein [Halomonas sp. LR3S48]UYG01769.1 hypothetical protein OCT51_11145 [Halomonas sp. LR3S48]
MSSLTNPAAHRSWINIAADRQHSAVILVHGRQMAKLWDYSSEEAKERARKMIELVGWRSAQVVLHAP